MQKRFTLMLAPALIGLVGVWVLRMLGLIDPSARQMMCGHRCFSSFRWSAPLRPPSWSGPSSPTGCETATTSRKMRFSGSSGLQILVVMATPYLALAAYVLAVPRFYLAGTVLAMLYAMYYHYPTTRRLIFDRRIFRVR